MRIIQITAAAVLAIQFFTSSPPEGHDSKRDNPPIVRPPELGQQVATYVGYPQMLRRYNREGVVVIGLRTGKANRITHVNVYSEDDQLKQYLVNRLQGKTLRGVQLPSKEQLVRLHFKLR